MLADLIRMNGGKSKKTYDVQDATVVYENGVTGGNGGRKLVRLSNGWLVAIVMLPDYEVIELYKSIDNGTTWDIVISAPGAANMDFSMVALKSTEVLVLTTSATSPAIFSYRVDVALGTARIDVIDTNLIATGNVTLTINPQGTELHAAWSCRTNTYSISSNIRYAKGVINGDGSVTWGAVEQWSTAHGVGNNVILPSITVDKDGFAIVIAQVVGSNYHSIVAYSKNGKINGPDYYVLAPVRSVLIYTPNVATYTQSSPSAIFVPTEVNGLPNGRIWVAWVGIDSAHAAYNLRLSYSSDGGSSWSSMLKITSYSSVPYSGPSITSNGLNEIFISHVNRMFKSVNDFTFSEIQGTNYRLGKSLLFDQTFNLRFIEPLFIYTDVTNSKVGFYGKWKE